MITHFVIMDPGGVKPSPGLLSLGIFFLHIVHLPVFRIPCPLMNMTCSFGRGHLHVSPSYVVLGGEASPARLFAIDLDLIHRQYIHELGFYNKKNLGKNYQGNVFRYCLVIYSLGLCASTIRT